MEPADDNDSSAMDSERRIVYLMCVYAPQQSALPLLRADIRSARAESVQLQERLLTNDLMFAAFEDSVVIPRSIQAFRRNERWFEDTPPHFPEHFFKQSFPVKAVTFRYLVDVCRPHMEREVTSMCSTIPVEKRVVAALYKLCSSAEDGTIANLFGLGRSTVNENYREFCRVVVSVPEQDWFKMVSATELSDHIREFQAALEFPLGIGVLDGGNFSISLPKISASGYHNYKGWYSIILLALVNHHYRFRYVNVNVWTLGFCHDTHVYRRSALDAVLQEPTLGTPMVTVTGTTVPPLILFNQAFPLTSNILEPYPRKDVKKGSPQEGFNRQLPSESDVAMADKTYLQAVCTTNAEADNGQSVRDAIAGDRKPKTADPDSCKGPFQCLKDKRPF
ncbi:hypothetical protein HPB47_011510 [Ixodes persulcatus]|uniref:Uncharacterized protein n=1 Tax=Ixodes persulcatus TaxID=34615 RepID=A0AC60NW37_IXOPE|nr:hypothetical protein HPB47_011510 [Ixodes persulcatus]